MRRLYSDKYIYEKQILHVDVVDTDITCTFM